MPTDPDSLPSDGQEPVIRVTQAKHATPKNHHDRPPDAVFRCTISIHIKMPDYTSTIGSEGGDDASFAAQSFALPRIARATNAGDELDQICKSEFQTTLSDAEKSLFPGFPLKCLPIVKLLPGNHCCVDCGDQEQEGLVYGSVGYGTLLCKDCAFRHVTNTEEKSEVKSLTDDIWDLHSILSLFEGGNTQMLEYIKDKPRWRAKGKSNKEDSEDVISFKQIYLSKAATAYRTNLANKVEHVYQNRMEALKEDATKREERAIRRSIKNRNPFSNILEMNDVPPDDIPGIFSNANTGFRKFAPRTTRIIEEEEENPSSANAYTPDAAQVDRIKQRINAKFSRNGSRGDYSNLDQPRSNSHQEDYPPTRYLPQAQGGRRRSIDLVGEVGGVFIQGQDEDISTKFVTDNLQTEDFRNTEKPQIREFWLHHQEDQRYTNNTHAPRSNAILGTYNRRGSWGTPGEAPRRQSSMESPRSSHAPQRPQFRPPQID